jgi:hypothetical protein
MTTVSTPKRTAHAAATTLAAALVATLISGCGAVNPMKDQGGANTTDAEQSKAQVVDAAKEIVAALKLPVDSAYFRRSSCNDQGDPPFQGSVRIWYPLAPSSEASDAQVAEWVRVLRTKGWTTPGPDFHTHATALSKNGVSVTFDRQGVGRKSNGIELLGECLDMTTTKETAGLSEDIDLG